MSARVKTHASPRRAAFLIGLVLVVLGSSIAHADINWRTKGAVTNVKNQGTSACNLSWAFAVTGLVEGAYAVQQGVLVNLSEQALIDCASGCDGLGARGCPDASCAPLTCAFNFITANGLCSEATYPYTGTQGGCKSFTPVVPAGFAVNWLRLPAGEASLAAELNAAPVLARLEIGQHGATLPSYLAYDTGVFDPPPTDASVVQWVLVVGYTGDRWIIKNSLGTGWGMSGYLELRRGVNALGVNNVLYALKPGPRVAGACALPDGTCAELGSGECETAGGVSGGVGTFCPVPCTAPAPALSRGAVVGLALLLAATGLVGVLRRSSTRPAG